MAEKTPRGVIAEQFKRAHRDCCYPDCIPDETLVAADSILSALTSAGYVIVPYAPTNKMLAAAAAAMSPDARKKQEWVSVKQKHKWRYQAMLAAAQETSGEKDSA